VRAGRWFAALAFLAVLAPAQADATTCPTSPGPQTVTFSLLSTPAEQTCVVPALVTSIHVMAVGAPGGEGIGDEPAGAGAVASGTLSVTPGGTLYIEVGGPGGQADYGHGTPGFNGGGNGNGDGAGGGGATDVRTAPVSAGLSPDPRVLIAGGGGGAGMYGFASPTVPGGNGGAAGAQGGDGTANGVLGGGGGGLPGSSSAGGSGGSAGTTSGSGNGPGTAGGGGTLGQGGAGSDMGIGFGGGGGGGLYGGGGGGSGSSNASGDSGGGGGGGGGSSLVPTGGSVTANNTSLPPEVVISYTVPEPPTAQISTPASGQTYALGESVATTFSCTEGTGGSGIKSCTDSTGHTATTGTITGSLNTSTAGSETYTVTATSSDGLTGTASITYTVVLEKPANIAPPAITGTPSAGHVLSCSTGTWANTPTTYAYQWSLDGTPIADATSATYTVQAIDEGNTLTCAVAAINSAGAGATVTSAAVTIPVPYVARCPGATGRLSGTKLGPVTLGDTKKQAEHAFTHSSSRGQRYEDFFCLTPIGIRVGFASPKLLDTLPAGKRKALEGRVIWISTSSAYYAVDGIRPGATIAAAEKKLKLGKEFAIGANDWYLGPAGSATAVLKVRRGLVEEIGIGDKALTSSRKAQRTFLTSFS
jgi:hypothetical protein